MRNFVHLSGGFLLLGTGVLAAQTEPLTSRSTTERPNLSAPGMQQTLSGVLMDAACSAIADSRSELTKTPRIVKPESTRAATERAAAERSPTVDASQVPDNYNNCRLKTGTTSFALYSNGRVYMLDRVSNQMMQEHVGKSRPRTNSRDWHAITLVGSTTSDDVLTLRSIGK